MRKCPNCDSDDIERMADVNTGITYYKCNKCGDESRRKIITRNTNDLELRRVKALENIEKELSLANLLKKKELGLKMAELHILNGVNLFGLNDVSKQVETEIEDFEKGLGLLREE